MNNKEVSGSRESLDAGAGANAWGDLKDVPFAGERAEKVRDPNNPLGDPEAVLDVVHKNAVKGGKVYDRATGAEVTDKDEIIDTKAAWLVFERAKSVRENSPWRGAKEDDPYQKVEVCVGKALERFGLAGKGKAKYAEGKLFDRIVAEEDVVESVLGDVQDESQYTSMFLGGKQGLALGMLEYRLRQEGKDLVRYKTAVDTSKLQQDGVSRMRIKIQTAPRGGQE